MSDTPTYQSQSRDYFRKLKSSHMEEYKYMEKELGNPSRSGYPRYKHDLRVAELTEKPNKLIESKILSLLL